MPSIYLTNVVGTGGSTPDTAYRPNITTQGRWVVLMIHEAKAKAIVVAQDDTISGAGITKLLTGTNLADLRQKAKTTNPSGAQRTAMATWLSTNGYQPLTAAQTTWWECLHFIARQVNPSADLDLVG